MPLAASFSSQLAMPPCYPVSAIPCLTQPTLKGWLRVLGLIRRACGGEVADNLGIDGTKQNDDAAAAAAAPARPPEIAFKLALQVCVLCARPDAGLEVLRLMPSAGLEPPLDAFKVRCFDGVFKTCAYVVLL